MRGWWTGYLWSWQWSRCLHVDGGFAVWLVEMVVFYLNQRREIYCLTKRGCCLGKTCADLGWGQGDESSGVNGGQMRQHDWLEPRPLATWVYIREAGLQVMVFAR